jgi:solute carrier family 35 protein E3
VAFHFAITWITLHLASRPVIGAFAPARTGLLGILPLTIAMGANVVLMNLSLAYSSVVFYQIVRILLTPLTALMNLFIYGSKIPFLAVMALLPACAGVGVVSYLEATSKQDSASHSTSMLGVIFAFTGVAVSALYTVWVSAYYRKLKMTSSQLLLNQMPLGGLILAVSSYYTDKYPVWSEISREQWLMIGIVSLRPRFALDQY